MIPAHLLPLTVTWQQPGTTTDGYGNEIDDWSDGVRTDTEIAAYIEQRSTSETRDGTTRTTGLLFVTNELDVRATHRVVWDVNTFEIDGDCGVFHTPTGPHHLEASLLRVS